MSPAVQEEDKAWVFSPETETLNDMPPLLQKTPIFRFDPNPTEHAMDASEFTAVAPLFEFENEAAGGAGKAE